MPNKSISMNKIRQVLRCHAAGYGSRSISVMLSVSRTTVRKYLLCFMRSRMEIEDVLSMDEKSLYALFHEQEPERKPQPSPRSQQLDALLPDYMKRLKRRHQTREMLFREYSAACPGGYCRSHFYYRLQNYIIQHSPVSHIEHRAGDKMYVDYAGDRLYLTDPESGEKRSVEVFVAILPCSQLTYVEAVSTQRKEDFIRACENALVFFGGAPLAIVPDNLKAAVSRPGRWESDINRDFAMFAEHYGCAGVPARVRRPRDKALVESAVKLIYRSIYPRVRQSVHHTLEELNASISIALEVHNNALMYGRTTSRREQYEDLERECMRPLNPHRFEMRRHSVSTVSRSGYVRVDGYSYSVPYRYIGKKLDILSGDSEIGIYYRCEPIATHKRGSGLNRHITDPSHRPGQTPSDRDPARLVEKAAGLHPSISDYLSQVISERRYPDLASKSCRGILSLAGKVGVERLARACRLAQSYGMFSLRSLTEILDNRQDLVTDEDDTAAATAEPSAGHIPDHGNLRGKEYFT